MPVSIFHRRRDPRGFSYRHSDDGPLFESATVETLTDAEAASEIIRLRRENEELRSAFRERIRSKRDAVRILQEIYPELTEAEILDQLGQHQMRARAAVRSRLARRRKIEL